MTDPIHTEIEGRSTDARIMGLPEDELEDNVLDQIQTMIDHRAFQAPVRIMPDTHVGSGATIGFTMPIKPEDGDDPVRVVPNTIGVDIGCFTGNTEVRMLDGGSKNIQKLAEKEDSFGVYSVTTDGEVKAAEATAHKTREDTELVELELDNGKTISCTPDHEFMQRDGEYVEAQNLDSGTSLMALYTGTSDHGYRMVFDSDTEEITGKLAHWMVARSDLMDIPTDIEDPVIHHKNFDKVDNRPENLEIMERDEHSSLHRGLADDEHWQSEEFERKRISALKNREPTEKERQVATENITTWMDENPEDFQKVTKDAGERGSQYLEDFNTSERTCEICGDTFDNPGAEYWHEVKKHPEETEYDTSNKNAQSAIQNHKVVSVTHIDKTEDVYCLNVPEYQNFALDAGIFVHNCGMLAVRVDRANELPGLEGLEADIRDVVPTGYNVHDGAEYHFGEDFPWGSCARKWNTVKDELGLEDPEWFEGYSLEDYFKPACRRVEYDMMRAINSMGTLGGGNHFIEMGEDETGDAWFVIHSGSRGMGLSIAQHWQDKATDLRTTDWIRQMVPSDRWQYVVPDRDDDELDQWFLGGKGQSYIDSEAIREDFSGREIGDVHDEVREGHPDNRGEKESLDYLEGQEAAGYLVDMIFAQTYAWENREVMMESVLNAAGVGVSKIVHTPHNLIDFDDFVLRKGAVRAHEGEEFVLPFNMADGTYIVEGKGNEAWNRSAPHGAGRVMSRTRAFNELEMDEFEGQMEDVYSTSVTDDTLDEAPGAYKKKQLIEDAIEPTGDVVHKLTPVMNLKALD